ncbi:MAG: hypothetical protein Q9191_005752, partial [Dirinaria sp. TL-2023a]
MTLMVYVLNASSSLELKPTSSQVFWRRSTLRHGFGQLWRAYHHTEQLLNHTANFSNDRSGSTGYGSGMTSGTGFGNKSTSGIGDQTSLPADYGTDNRDRSQLGGNTDPYSGSNDYGSGTIGGAGFGNKSSGDDPSLGSSDSYGGNADLARSSDPYSGSNDYGSGTTGGAGFGNKSSGSNEDSSGGDSKAGKFMEKIGGMMGNEKMERKGLEK